jgi:hypothetical protein
MWILIAIGIVVILGLLVAVSRQRRTTGLRRQFGSEYDRTLDARDNRRTAEAELRGRAKRRASVDVRPLTEASRNRYASEWANVQAQFVDQPTDAVRSADGLVHRVMNERGYPMDNFEGESDLISVDHPDVVDNFRSAHNVFLRAQAQQATTEDMRSAMLHYRSLFDELLVADAPSSSDLTRDDGGHAATVSTARSQLADQRPVMSAPVDASAERPRP